MKIIGFNGSPRLKANTSQLLEAVLENCRTEGHETKTYHLDRMNIKGCKSCYACQTEKGAGKCAMKDDMNDLLQEIANADAVVLASPVYMWQVSGQAKTFTDRLLPLLMQTQDKKFIHGQKMLCVYTQGQPDNTKFASYYEYSNSLFSTMGFQVLPPLVATDVRMPDDIKAKTEVFEDARKMAALLVK